MMRALTVIAAALVVVELILLAAGFGGVGLSFVPGGLTGLIFGYLGLSVLLMVAIVAVLVSRKSKHATPTQSRHRTTSFLIAAGLLLWIPAGIALTSLSPV